MSDVTTNNGLNQSCGSETCTLTGEKVCTDEPQQLPTINYDKLFSQLLNMNLLNQCKQEQDDEGDKDEEDEEDEDDEDEDEEEEDEDEGDEDSDYSDEGFSLDAKWKTINKLVESHLNITNSIATLLNNS
jgi:cobalamin biosynthesis protein CobT